MKKDYISLIISFICLVSVYGQDKPTLKFNDNGEFKIVQFTDTHINLEKKSNLKVYQIVEDVIDIEKPDLVIFTGDNVTENEPQEAYLQLEEIFKKSKTPWAAVFGNHDGQGKVKREYFYIRY